MEVINRYCFHHIFVKRKDMAMEIYDNPNLGADIEQAKRDFNEIRAFFHDFFADGKEKTVKDWLAYCEEHSAIGGGIENDMTAINSKFTVSTMTESELNEVVTHITLESYGMLANVDYIYPESENNPFTAEILSDEYGEEIITISDSNLDEIEEAVGRDYETAEFSSQDNIDRAKALLEFLRETDKDYQMYDIVEDYQEWRTYETSYKTPEGEFTVMTDDEAMEYLADDIENLIDECGLKNAFGENYWEYVRDNFVEWDNGEEWFRDDHETYLRDIESETYGYEDSIFENRLQKELFEALCDTECLEDYKNYRREIADFEATDDPKELARKILDGMGLEDVEPNTDDIQIIHPLGYIHNENTVEADTDIITDIIIKGKAMDSYGEFSSKMFLWLSDPKEEGREEVIAKYIEGEYDNSLVDIKDIREWFENYEDNKEELIKQAIDKYIDGLDGNYLEEYLFQLGDDNLKYLIENGECSIDYKGIAEWTESIDGLGRIASYDGVDNEVGDYHIFCMDDKGIERRSVPKEMPSITKEDVSVEKTVQKNKGNGKVD